MRRACKNRARGALVRRRPASPGLQWDPRPGPHQRTIFIITNLRLAPRSAAQRPCLLGPSSSVPTGPAPWAPLPVLAVPAGRTGACHEEKVANALVRAETTYVWRRGRAQCYANRSSHFAICSAAGTNRQQIKKNARSTNMLALGSGSSLR